MASQKSRFLPCISQTTAGCTSAKSRRIPDRTSSSAPSTSILTSAGGGAGRSSSVSRHQAAVDLELVLADRHQSRPQAVADDDQFSLARPRGGGDSVNLDPVDRVSSGVVADGLRAGRLGLDRDDPSAGADETRGQQAEHADVGAHVPDDRAMAHRAPEGLLDLDLVGALEHRVGLRAPRLKRPGTRACAPRLRRAWTTPRAPARSSADEATPRACQSASRCHETRRMSSHTNRVRSMVTQCVRSSAKTPWRWIVDIARKSPLRHAGQCSQPKRTATSPTPSPPPTSCPPSRGCRQADRRPTPPDRAW